jgi:hypothetical protein
MQIAGQICRTCRKSIVLSREGKFCDHCDVYAHISCEPGDLCGVCGQAYHSFEAAKVDVLGEAILPPGLRPPASSGPAFAIFAMALGAGLIIAACLVIQYILAQGMPQAPVGARSRSVGRF